MKIKNEGRCSNMNEQEKKVMSARTYHGLGSIGEVKEVRTAKEVNELLREGWVLLNTGSGNGKFLFSLGLAR